MPGKRILFYSEGWGTGGIESFIMNTVRRIYEYFDFDIFCVHDYDTKYDDEISDLGGKRYTLFSGHRPNNIVRLIEGPRAWRRLLGGTSYDIVHVNTMNGMGLRYVAIARAMDVPLCIAHSHNSDVGSGAHELKLALHDCGRQKWGGAAHKRLACSVGAGVHLFGNQSFEVIPNAVDTGRFAYSDDSRYRVRDYLKIPQDVCVAGFIGRLDGQKNPLKVVDVFSKMAREDSKMHFLVIGQGDMSDSVREKVSSLPSGINNRFRLLDRADRIHECYSALDVMVQPSRFEGLPMTMVEAQVAGLAQVVSGAFPDEGIVTDLITRLDVDDSVDKWAKAAMGAMSGERKRRSYSALVAQSAFGESCFKASLHDLYQ